MASLGKLLVELSADVASFKSDMGRATRIMDQQTKRMERSGQRIDAMFARMSKAAKKFLGAFAVSIGGVSIDRITARAQRLGQAVENLNFPLEDLQRYQAAAGQAGVDVGRLETAFQRMIRRVSQAADGTGEARDALRELGLDAAALEQLNTAEMFREITRAIEPLAAADKTRLLQKIFDSEGVQAVLKTMEAVEDLGDKFDDLFLTEGELGNLRKLRGALDNVGTAASTAASKGLAKLVDVFGKIEASSPIWLETLETLLRGLGADGLADVVEPDKLDAINGALRETDAEMGQLLARMGELADEDITEGLAVERLNKELQRVQNRYKVLLDQQRALLRGGATRSNPGGRPDVPGGLYPRDPPALKIRGSIPEKAATSKPNELAAAAEEANAQYQILITSMDEMPRALDSAVEKSRELESAGRSLGFTFQSAFEDAVIEGENLRTVLEGILKDIARIVLRLTVTTPLANTIAEAVAGGFSGVFGGGGASVGATNSYPDFYKGLASGGPANAGQAYVVGERGPELFVPRQSGTVVPNHAMGGNAANISFTVNAIDAASFQSTLAQHERQITGMVRKGFARRGSRVDIG